MIFAPVSTEDSGGVCRQSEDGFQFSFHHALFLRLHIVADGIVLCLYIIFLSIAETVNGKVCLQRIAAGEFIDTAHIPAQTLVAHFVVGAACDVFSTLRTVRDFI